MSNPSYEVRVVERREEDFLDIVRRGSMVLSRASDFVVEPVITQRVEDKVVRDQVYSAAVSLAKKLEDDYDVSITIKRR